MNLLPLLGSFLSGIVYSIAGWHWSWMRTWLICPVLLVVMLCTKIFDIRLLYPILLGGSWIIGYGTNCPLSKFFRKIGWTDEFKIKFTVRLINALAIAGSVIVLNHGFWFLLNALYFIPLYVWLGVYNPCKDIKIWKWTINAARVEEFLIGFTSTLIPYFLIW